MHTMQKDSERKLQSGNLILAGHEGQVMRVKLDLIQRRGRRGRV
jgi:hypothetical protein